MRLDTISKVIFSHLPVYVPNKKLQNNSIPFTLAFSRKKKILYGFYFKEWRKRFQMIEM